MTLRQKLYLHHALMAVVLLFVGFVAFITNRQLRQVLGEAADVPPSVLTLLSRADLIVLVSIGVGLLVVLGLGWYAARSVAAPLHRLTEAARELSTGTLNVNIPVDGDDEIGELATALNDMTESIRRRTVSRSYLNNILDSMAEMLFVVDPSGTIRQANRATREHLGFSDDELEGLPITQLFESEEPWTRADHEQLQRQGYTDHAERTLRTKKGHTLPVLFSRAALRSDTNDLQGVVCVAQDISERKEAEEKIKASLREKEVLLREIHHRVKNNLQIISSLLHLQSKSVDGEEAEALFAESQHRIRSMALIHERLYQSDDLARVDFGSYLEGLTEHLVRSYGARGITLNVEAEDAPLSVDRAIPCGLIVNELVTNALKHAFPDGEPGTITVRFAHEDEEARLTIADDGVGVPDEADLETADSLGLKLVRGLVQQLNGSMDIATPSGLQFSITFPTAS